MIDKILNLIKKIIKAILILIYAAFVISLVIGGIYSGIWTLIPTAILGKGATKNCYLGYVAHCSFAPFSTLMLFAMALIGLVLLIKLTKYFKRKFANYLQPDIKHEKSITQ